MDDFNYIFEDEPCSLEQIAQIEYLMNEANVESHWVDKFNPSVLTRQEADKAIQWLSERQLNKIHSGFNYNQSYILWHLRNTI